jgi:ribosomal-protein-serine acetyltransferase
VEIKIDDELALILRRPEDAEEFYQLTDRNRAHLHPWLPWIDETNSTSDTRQYIERCIEHFRHGTAVDLGIRYQGAWVGSIGLNSIHPLHRKAELGYWLDKAVQGQGVMTRAARSLIEYGFERLDLHRIWLRVRVNNVRSAAIPARLGFYREGVIRQDEWCYDHFTDHVVFGLLRAEWEAQQSDR